MASILRVNTLTDASSNNSTAMSTINQGTAKSWLNFNGTGTIAARDSFNFSGLTDVSQGNYTVTMSTAMGNTNYAFNGSAAEDAAGAGARIIMFGSNLDSGTLDPNFTTTSYSINGMYTMGSSGGDEYDITFIGTQIFGDLA
tara:strand:- start:30 stop:455 length:426 start_codon:yes stop_codon:yes gene_type:complete